MHRKFNRPDQIRIDCSRTTTGLFAGLAFLAFTLVSIGLFQAYVVVDNSSLASMVFFSIAFLLFIISSIACKYILLFAIAFSINVCFFLSIGICAIWRIRRLNYDKMRIVQRTYSIVCYCSSHSSANLSSVLRVSLRCSVRKFMNSTCRLLFY